jgi:hypothetical protein
MRYEYKILVENLNVMDQLGDVGVEGKSEIYFG